MVSSSGITYMLRLCHCTLLGRLSKFCSGHRVVVTIVKDDCTGYYRQRVVPKQWKARALASDLIGSAVIIVGDSLASSITAASQ